MQSFIGLIAKVVQKGKWGLVDTKERELEEYDRSKGNVISLIEKLMLGIGLILLVGIAAYAVLFLLMNMI